MIIERDGEITIVTKSHTVVTLQGPHRNEGNIHTEPYFSEKQLSGLESYKGKIFRYQKKKEKWYNKFNKGIVQCLFIYKILFLKHYSVYEIQYNM